MGRKKYGKAWHKAYRALSAWNKHRDPDGVPRFPDAIDPDGVPRLPDAIDPDGVPRFPDAIDPDGVPRFPDAIDPDGVPRFPDAIDPSGHYETDGRTYRRGCQGSGALRGDFPSGRRPGNVRTSVEEKYSGAVVIRLAPQFTTEEYDQYRTLRALGDHSPGEDEEPLSALEGLRRVLDDAEFELAGRHARRLVETPRRAVIEPDAVAGEKETISKAAAKLDRRVHPADIRTLERTAANEGELAPLHSLNAYWRLNVNHLKRGPRRRFLRQLNELTEVDRAYRELAVSDPSNGSADTFEGSQGYLERAPFGIDALWARSRGGDGGGIAFVDLEQGWIVDHQELGKSELIHGSNRHEASDYRGDHGTAVLGEVVATRGLNDATMAALSGVAPPGGTGVAGITPRVTKLGLASHYKAAETPADGGPTQDASDGHVAEAIYAAIGMSPWNTAAEPVAPYLKPGDVLLIEVQRSYLPAEVDDADFDAIRLATALGIIVIEAAGNGSRDLDAYRQVTWERKKKKNRNRGARILNRRSGGFRESGAIMVGAALSQLPHDRKRASNYGSRIDCFAWGDRVVTSGYGDFGTGGDNDNDTQGYTADFSNTSAAAPIIAGAALAVQSMYRAATKTKTATDGYRLWPGQMRALLANPATSTRQGRGVYGHIGVMPDLKAIAQNSLRIVPDVYLRDRIGDLGTVPSRRSCTSPDVLVSQDAKAVFSEGSGTENDPTAGSKVVKKKDNYLFVRMRNRGRCDAKEMVATVYWSPAATLVTPDMWREIDCCEPLRVPQGDILAVSDPFQWQERDLPKPGYYCLITLLEDTAANERSPLPPGLQAAQGARALHVRRQIKAGVAPESVREPDRVAIDDFDWYAFLAFQHRNNHLAVRNLHVVDKLVDRLNKAKELGFQITGTPEGDHGRFFDLEVLQRLPKKAELKLYVPMELAPALAVDVPWKSETAEAGAYRCFTLPPLPSVPFFRVPLAAGAAHDCYFSLTGVDLATQRGHSIAIRQLFRGREVGRVTWHLQSPATKKC